MAFACWLPVSCAAGTCDCFFPHTQLEGVCKSHWSPAAAGRSVVCNYVHLEYLGHWIWFFGSLNKGSWDLPFTLSRYKPSQAAQAMGQSIRRIMNNVIGGFWLPWDHLNYFYHRSSKCPCICEMKEKNWERPEEAAWAGHIQCLECVSACWHRGTSALMYIHPQT